MFVFMKTTGTKAPVGGRAMTEAKAEMKPQVFNVRGKRVVLDRDVAAYVGVQTMVLNQIVKRNHTLFDEEKLFQISKEELLISQIAISNSGGRGGTRKPPYAFTAEGILVLERVLKREIKIDFEPEVNEAGVLPESWSEGSVVLYQPNENIKINVRVENETVWLTQEQMALLFGTTTQNITIHIGNIFLEKEVEEWATCKDYLQVQIEGEREVRRNVKLYNLDIIISIGYRVKSIQGTRFRQWALNVLKGVLLHGHYYDSRIDKLEQTVSSNVSRINNLEKQYELIVDTKLSPVEMIFYEGENFKAFDFICTLIESASKRIVLIDNYVDRKVLLMLNKRKESVPATIFTHNKRIEDVQFKLDIEESNRNRKAPLIEVRGIKKDHDRFLIIDETVYLLGPSVKDAGVHRCAAIKMKSTPDALLKNLN